MSKSKYPQQLDTSVEIPPIRDNITEIGSDVINSLRSAIFKIEAVLGINPQGAVGNTVASRISNVIDENGNILHEALSRSNVLSGPILDVDVSNVAAIKESKLKLDYPTTLLQDEISIVNSELNLIREAIEELATILAVHIEPTALNRHSAVSINVAGGNTLASDISSLSVVTGSLQSVIDEIYNSHINYTGANISEINNSHTAAQVYYDNLQTSTTIFSDSVQGAIDDLANIEKVGFRNTFLNITSNGRVRSGSITDKFEGNDLGSILLDTSAATYITSGGTSTTIFSLVTAQIPSGSISEYDFLTLSGAIDEDDNKDYQIKSVNIDGLGLLQTVTVYGGPRGTSTSGLSIIIHKNPYVSYNSGGFACTVRPRANKTNTPDVQYLNPDSATIISRNIIPSNILADNHTFDIMIDGNSPITINTFNASVSYQTLDSIVQVINDQCVDQHLNFTAFKVKSLNCFELALSHNVPNVTGDFDNRTLEVLAGSTDDGTSALGLSTVLDVEFEGNSGNSLNLNGLLLSEFGLIKSFTEANVEITPGTLTLTHSSSNFVALGVRIGDLVVISGSTVSSDDGSYRVGSITGSVITLDLSGTLFSGTLDASSVVHIIRATAPVGEFTFEEIGTLDGSILFDVFMTEEKDVFQTKRMEVEGSLLSGSFVAAVSDISRSFILSGQTSVLTIGTDGFAVLTDPTLQTGAPVYVGATGLYQVFASDSLSFITLNVNATGLPLTAQTVTLYGFDEVSSNNYHMCRGGFSTSLGRVLGDSLGSGIPTLVDKRNSGTADHSIIGESVIEKFIEGPRNELRASGIIKGCEVVNPTYVDLALPADIYQTFSVTAGIVVVNGIRYEFPGIEDIRFNSDESYIVAFDKNGCIIFDNYVDNPLDPGNDISPFYENEVAYLGEVNNDAVSAASVIDLRLFIDNLDYRVLKEIIVSTDRSFGHYTDIPSAVSYAKRFSKMFSGVDTPSIYISSGTFEVDETILVDFDVNISGAGSRTIIRKGANLVIGTQLVGDDVDLATSIFMIGGGSNTESADIFSGIKISDLTFNATTVSNVGCFISLTQPIIKTAVDVSRRATYRFENIFFNGPSNVDGTAADPNKIGEFAIVIGQQDPNTLIPVTNITMGNVMVHNCRFHRCGVEMGAIKFIETAGIAQDIIVSNNIVTRGSPNLGSNSSIVVEYPSTVTLSNLIESGNSFRTAN